MEELGLKHADALGESVLDVDDELADALATIEHLGLEADSEDSNSMEVGCYFKHPSWLRCTDRCFWS